MVKLFQRIGMKKDTNKFNFECNFQFILNTVVRSQSVLRSHVIPRMNQACDADFKLESIEHA